MNHRSHRPYTCESKQRCVVSPAVWTPPPSSLVDRDRYNLISFFVLCVFTGHLSTYIHTRIHIHKGIWYLHMVVGKDVGIRPNLLVGQFNLLPFKATHSHTPHYSLPISAPLLPSRQDVLLTPWMPHKYSNEFDTHCQMPLTIFFFYRCSPFLSLSTLLRGAYPRAQRKGTPSVWERSYLGYWYIWGSVCINVLLLS